MTPNVCDILTLRNVHEQHLGASEAFPRRNAPRRRAEARISRGHGSTCPEDSHPNDPSGGRGSWVAVLTRAMFSLAGPVLVEV